MKRYLVEFRLNPHFSLLGASLIGLGWAVTRSSVGTRTRRSSQLQFLGGGYVVGDKPHRKTAGTPTNLIQLFIFQ